MRGAFYFWSFFFIIILLVQVGRVAVIFEPTLWTSGDSSYNLTLNVAEASISIATSQYNVLLFVDANSNTVYVNASSADDTTFSISASVQIYRTQVQLSNLG